MKAFLICSEHESHRASFLDELEKKYPFHLEKTEACYPSKIHVPFLDRLMDLSAKRTGTALMPGELGCLLSHRKVWQKILKEAKDDEQHFMVFESDSRLIDPGFLEQQSLEVARNYDIFFWGAWEGHMKLFRSSRRKIGSHCIGIPYLRTVYCTYGYSLNRRAATILLKRTAKTSWPVDQFKYFFGQEELRLGGITPEVVVGNEYGSMIRGKENRFVKKLFLMILDIKNELICFFR